MNRALTRAQEILRAAYGDRVRTAFPLAPLTSFRLGGPAALYVEPNTISELSTAGEAIVETRIPFVVIGKAFSEELSARVAASGPQYRAAVAVLPLSAT